MHSEGKRRTTRPVKKMLDTHSHRNVAHWNQSWQIREKMPENHFRWDRNPDVSRRCHLLFRLPVLEARMVVKAKRRTCDRQQCLWGRTTHIYRRREDVRKATMLWRKRPDVPRFVDNARHTSVDFLNVWIKESIHSWHYHGDQVFHLCPHSGDRL